MKKKSKTKQALVGYVVGSIIGTLVSALILIKCFSSATTNTNTLSDFVYEARSRNYGTVCSDDKNGRYCVVAYTDEYPKVMVDFDSCVKDARILTNKKQKGQRLHWCQCMAKNSFGVDLGVALYRCGTGWSFHVIKAPE